MQKNSFFFADQFTDFTHCCFGGVCAAGVDYVWCTVCQERKRTFGAVFPPCPPGSPFLSPPDTNRVPPPLDTTRHQKSSGKYITSRVFTD